MSDRIALGVIRKPHGIRGEASVEAWTDSLERFQELDRVFLVSPDENVVRQAEVESARAHAGRVLVHFRGVDSPESLRELQNWTIEIPESEAKKPGEDEYFLYDLIGLRLVDEGGTDRGEIVDAYEGGGGVLLRARREGREFEVPFASAICRRIDLGERRIVVALPEGLDDLDRVED